MDVTCVCVYLKKAVYIFLEKGYPRNVILKQKWDTSGWKVKINIYIVLKSVWLLTIRLNGNTNKWNFVWFFFFIFLGVFEEKDRFWCRNYIFKNILINLIVKIFSWESSLSFTFWWKNYYRRNQEAIVFEFLKMVLK